MNYTTDGKQAVNKMGPLGIKSTLKWVGNSLVISSDLSSTMPISQVKPLGPFPLTAKRSPRARVSKAAWGIPPSNLSSRSSSRCLETC